MLSARRQTVLIAVIAAVLLVGGIPALAATDARLVVVARDRDRAAVVNLIKQRVDVNVAEADGSTALHWAAHWNDLDIADLLIRAGARVNAANQFGATPLWLASEQGNTTMIQRLLDAGADPNTALRLGETPLMAAARTGNEAAVVALLGAGARVDAKEGVYGQNALMWAAAENHLRIMRLLVDRGAGVNETSKAGFTPLMFVARQGNMDAVTLLLSKGADLNATAEDGSTPLLIATVRGYVDLALNLLERNANPNTEKAGYTPLHWVAGVWEAPITFDYRLTGELAAIRGVPTRQGKLRLLQALIAKGANVNAPMTTMPPRIGHSIFPEQRLPEATPVFLAAMSADREVVQLLKQAGADLTITTKNKTTPLIAAAGGFLRIDYETRIPESEVLGTVKLLVEELGADINAANELGETPLHMAALSGLDMVVEYLVAKGASLTAKTKDGKTPLATAEGTEVTMQLVTRPNTAVLLKKLGAER